MKQNTQEKNSKKKNLNKFSIFLERSGEIYFKKLPKESEWDDFTCSEKDLIKKKQFLSLNQKFEKSKLPWYFFKPWFKGVKRLLTSRQKHLKQLYTQFRYKPKKKRKDFFKTYFGEILKNTYINSAYTKRKLWLPGRRRNLHILQKKYYEYSEYKEALKSFRVIWKKRPWPLVKTQEKQYKILTNAMRRGWLYESVLKQTSRKEKYFELDRPKTAFQNHYKQQEKEPWVDPLVFKRWAYFGLVARSRKENKNQIPKRKPYLRKRNPRFQKRNQLYWWRQKLLFSFYKNNQINRDKAQRIKQVLGKIYLPFYGNLNKKQFQKIIKKNKKKKSKILNKNEKILSSLEARLDVIVYRLNLAPNIFWARRLIKEGTIFVNNIFSFRSWIEMYNNFKHLAFPLKLRDPKNLYKTIAIYPKKKISKFKFLLKPTKKIHYLLQPGDFVQSAKTIAINKSKSNTELLKKPITKNIYTHIKQKRPFWKNSVQAPKEHSFVKWQAPTIQRTAALFLFNAQFQDFKKNDRANELFFRWITL